MTHAGTADGVDADELANRVQILGRVMAAHGGAVELVSVNDGAVRVRFTGMCTGCLYRPLTFKGVVEPALLAVKGVRSVSAAGARISEQAAARMSYYLDKSGSSRLLPILTGGGTPAGGSLRPDGGPQT
ncbi:MAG: hypothetical protein QOJ62_672 [Actinomycetota bacterium]|jgi:Fe-S cluster biogenesis protein NfuA|nr:hypothetical protein [Actinomycetota bacterium]